MKPISKEIIAMATCTGVLDDLFEHDKDAIHRVLTFLSGHYTRIIVAQADAKIAELKRQREVVQAELEAVRRVQEADVLGCIKPNEDGTHYIDEEMYRAKRAEKLASSLTQ